MVKPSFDRKSDRTVLEVKQLAIGNGGRTLISDIDLSINSGEIISLIGDNGSGKSTLVRTLGGIQKPLAGQIYLNGAAFNSVTSSDKAKQIATVSAVSRENIMLSGYKFVSLGRYPFTGWNGILRKHDREAIDTAVDFVNVGYLMDRSIQTLSDGELQRLVIARALAQEPQIMLLDEPTIYLDSKSKNSLISILQKLAIDRGISIVSATHDVDHFEKISDTVWSIDIAESPRTILSGNTEDISFKRRFDIIEVSDQFIGDQEARNAIFIEASDYLKLLTERLFKRYGWRISETRSESQYVVVLDEMVRSDVEAVFWKLIGSDYLSEECGYSFSELADWIASTSLQRSD